MPHGELTCSEGCLAESHRCYNSGHETYLGNRPIAITMVVGFS